MRQLVNLCAGRKWREMDAAAQLTSAFSFHSVQDLSLWDGTTHIQDGSSLLKRASLVASPLRCPELCLQGDSKSSPLAWSVESGSGTFCMETRK